MNSFGAGAHAIGRGDRCSGAPFATRSPVLARRGMAATAQPLATLIAIDILKRGGTAVDGAIAANAALGLMEPVACGIGGDLFAIVWDPASKRLHGYNGSGRSPMGRSYADTMKKLAGREHIPPLGSLAVSVPGTVDAWFALHEKFGRLPMKELLAPAAAYANEGFPVSQYVAGLWRENLEGFINSDEIEEVDNAKRTFLLDGHSPKEGELFSNPGLARTYAVLAGEGRDAFYKGGLAGVMDAYFRRIGGDLRLDDFAAHRGEWVEPVSVNYRGYDVCELPPNGQGAAALAMLNILEGFDLSALGPGSDSALHLMIEAKRLAFEDLAKFFGDPAFSKIPLAALLSKDYAETRRALIDLRRAAPSIGPGDPKLSAGDTTYLAVADGDGMMVSLIQSNFRGMGSGLVPDGLGFMFQDRGELFSLDPASPNVYAPGKRPFHTIIPGFVAKDSEPLLAFGVMGADMQPQGHVQVLVNMIDFGMNVQEAGDFARFHHTGGSEVTGEPARGTGLVHLESGISTAAREGLERRGHVIVPGPGSFGGYQAILRAAANGVYWGASEMRKDGGAIGY